MRLKRFIDFFEEITGDNEIDSIIYSIPDSDIPSETCIIKKIGDKWIYTEGWCDRCFSNYDVYSREDKVELANELTEQRLRRVPKLPQYKYLRGKELIDFKFIEFPDNEVNYALSVGIYV